jgi:hypothetical protein
MPDWEAADLGSATLVWGPDAGPKSRLANFQCSDVDVLAVSASNWQLSVFQLTDLSRRVYEINLKYL